MRKKGKKSKVRTCGKCRKKYTCSRFKHRCRCGKCGAFGHSGRKCPKRLKRSKKA